VKRVSFWGWFALVLALLVAVPFGLNEYWMRVFSTVLMWVAMAGALNIILGLAGYPAFGNGAFFGVGGYTVAVLMHNHVGFWLAMAAAVVVPGAIATVIGVPVLRLRGHYFAIATIGVNFALLSLIQNLGFTGGGSGLSVPLFPGSAASLSFFFFYLFAALALLSVAVTKIVRSSRLGYAIRAIQASEEAALVMGINGTAYKVAAWAISAMLTGAAGGAYAYWNGYIEPVSMFDIVTSVKLFIMVLIGGAGTILGPVVGAVGIELVSEYLWSTLGGIHLAVLGLIILFTGIFVPRGLLSLRARRFRAARSPEGPSSSVGADDSASGGV